MTDPQASRAFAKRELDSLFAVFVVAEKAYMDARREALAAVERSPVGQEYRRLRKETDQARDRLARENGEIANASHAI